MSEIEEICGNYPEGFEKLDITSDPNYVFVNDPNYSAKQLFDAEGNKVFVRVHATADNMDTIFGHYFESTDEGKTKIMMTFDDTLSMFNAMKK